MRKYLLVLLSLVVSIWNLYSEEPKFTAAEIYPFGAGLFVAAKGGVNTSDSPDGIKNGFMFNSIPDIGAQVYVPFGLESNLGAILDLAYIGFNYKFREYNNDNNTWADKVSYFSISPNIHISGFLLGMNFGIPLSAKSGNNVAGNRFNYYYQTDNLNLMVDIHVGALVPLYMNDFGRLNLYIQGEYPLSGIFKNDLFFTNPAVSPTKKFNIQPVALKVGFSYIINTKLLQK